MKRILLVDDQSMVRGVLRVVLEQHGYICSEAGNGHEAMRCLHANLPVHLMITDNQMPGMNGLQLINRIKTSPPYRHLPIVLCSGYLSDETRTIARKNGVTTLLLKPIDVEKLLETVTEVLNEGQAESVR